MRQSINEDQEPVDKYSLFLCLGGDNSKLNSIFYSNSLQLLERPQWNRTAVFHHRDQILLHLGLAFPTLVFTFFPVPHSHSLGTSP